MTTPANEQQELFLLKLNAQYLNFTTNHFVLAVMPLIGRIVIEPVEGIIAHIAIHANCNLR